MHGLGRGSGFTQSPPADAHITTRRTPLGRSFATVDPAIGQLTYHIPCSGPAVSLDGTNLGNSFLGGQFCFAERGLLCAHGLPNSWYASLAAALAGATCDLKSSRFCSTSSLNVEREDELLKAEEWDDSLRADEADDGRIMFIFGVDGLGTGVGSKVASAPVVLVLCGALVVAKVGPASRQLPWAYVSGQNKCTVKDGF